MTLQKFFCPENGLSGGIIKEIEIPNYCPHCGNKLVVFNDPIWASVFEKPCEHFETYTKVWAERIISPIIDYGPHCTKCGNFYPYAIKVPGFVCYGCKMGF